MTRLSPSQYHGLAPRKNKFGARKTVVDGITFDSQAEANYYAALKVRERAGEIFTVEFQPRYALVINGILVASYRADFRFYDAMEGRERVVDVKGFDTAVSKIKRKMVRALYGVTVELAK